jgi:hypothetical protein
MKAKSESVIKATAVPSPDAKTIYWYERVRDVRQDFGRRIEEMSTKSEPTITDQLLLAYYQHVLRLFDSLPPETMVNAGYGMGKHCFGRQEEVLGINQIHDYLIPVGGGPAPQIGKMHLGPISAARRFAQRGRPVTRRSQALRALQLHIDTGQSWTKITKRICDCGDKTHELCTENIRQSVNNLKRFLRELGIQVPQRANRRRE